MMYVDVFKNGLRLHRSCHLINDCRCRPFLLPGMNLVTTGVRETTAEQYMSICMVDAELVIGRGHNAGGCLHVIFTNTDNVSTD